MYNNGLLHVHVHVAVYFLTACTYENIIIAALNFIDCLQGCLFFHMYVSVNNNNNNNNNLLFIVEGCC